MGEKDDVFQRVLEFAEAKGNSITEGELHSFYPKLKPESKEFNQLLAKLDKAGIAYIPNTVKNRDYYAEILREYKPLTQEKEKEMLKRYAQEEDQGEKTKIRDELLYSNLLFIMSQAWKKYRNAGENKGNWEDYVQAGVVAIILAIDGYDFEKAKGCRLVTYASNTTLKNTWWNLDRESLGIGKADYLITNKIRKAINKYVAQNGTQPSKETIAQETGLDVKMVEGYLLCCGDEISMNKLLGDESDNGNELQDTLEDENSLSVEQQAIMANLKENLIGDRLTDNEKKILCLRYGLADNKPLSVEETAKIMHTTSDKIQQIVGHALKKMRIEKLLE